MKSLGYIYRNVMMLSQLGLSFVTPILLCLALCWWLTSRFGIGGWVYIPGFFFGLGGSGMVGYKFYLNIEKKQKKENTGKKNKVYFNNH